MVKTLQLKLVLLLCMIMGAGTAWAEDFTLSSANEVTQNGITVSFAKGEGSNAPAWYSAGLRLYAKNTVTISSTNTITSITFNWEKQGSKAFASATANVGTYSHPGAAGEGTWTGSENEVVFTLGSSGQLQLNTFSVTVSSGSTSPTPSITANNVNITYDATGGSIEFTVNNPATGGSVSASTTDTWITLGNETASPISFTCTANTGGERMATVTLTYTYNTNQTVTKNVIVTQAANPNGPGTENNPYTVAQARAAIDAGTGVTGVYATGIVTAIPTAYNSSYGNITFNFVDNEGDEDFLQAYRCGGNDAENVQVGDIVVVYGNLMKYNNTTYEFAQGCELVSLTHPAVAVEAPTFSPVAGTYTETQNVTISCETSGATIYYTTDGTEPTSASTQYTSAISVSTYTTLKAIAIKGSDQSTVASATYHICSADDPYTVTQALTFSEYPANGIYVSGVVSTAPTQDPTSSGQLTYYISVDGQAENQLQVYKGKGLEQADFTAQDDIQVGDEVTIYGNVKIYNSTKEFDTGNYLVAFNRPAAPVVPVINANDVEMAYDATSGEIAYTITNPVPGTLLNATTTADWVSDINVEADKVTFTTTANEGTTDRAATFTLTYAGAADKTVTVTQGHYVAPAVDYATLPFEFDGGRADVADTDGLTQEGLDSDYGSSPKLKFNGTGDWVMLKFNEAPGTLTFDIKGNSFAQGTFAVQTSVDGVTYTDLHSYISLPTTTETKTFDNLASDVRYIRWIYTNKGSGNVALGNIKLEKFEVPSNSAPAWSDLPTPTINVGEDYELDLATYVTGTPTPTISLDTEVSTSLYDFEDGYLIFQPTAAGTYQFTFTATNSEGSENATLTVTAVEPGAVTTYTLATAIEPGKHYIIVSSIAAGDGKAMGKQNNNNRAAEAVTISGDGTTSAITASVTGDDVHEFLICGPDANERYTIFDESTENDGKDNGYLYAASSGSNHLKTQESNNVNSQWTISIDSESKVASIQADGEGSNSRNVMQFNSGSNLFSCYASASQGSVYLYVKDSEASTTVTRSVTIKADRQYTAFSSDVALDFTGTDLTAFIVTEATGTTRTVTKVPANTGVIVGLADVTTTQQVISVPVYTGTMDDVTDNMLVAVVTGKHIDQTDGDNTNYVFGKQGGKERFFKVNGTSGIDVPDNNAYLQIPTSLAKNLNVIEFGGDEATGINALETEALNGAIYNLQGQKVNHAQKGVYIVNGRKVVVK